MLIYANWQSGLREILIHIMYIPYLLFVMARHFIGFIKLENVNKTRIFKKFGCHKIILWQHWLHNRIGLYINA